MNNRPVRPGTTQASTNGVRTSRGDRHRADQHPADQHRADQYRADQYRADQYRADQFGGAGDRYPTSGSAALAPVYRESPDVEFADEFADELDAAEIGSDRDHADRDRVSRGYADRNHADRNHADRSHADRSHASRDHASRDHAEPARTRSAAERAAADERAAQRVAERAAGRASVDSRRRLRLAPPAPVNVARAPFVGFLIFVVIAGVVGILVLNTMINANQFRLNHLQAQQANLDQQQQQLQQTLAGLESPGSLVAAARKLGLVSAGTLAYIKMPDGSVVGLPGPASGTPSASTGQ